MKRLIHIWDLFHQSLIRVVTSTTEEISHQPLYHNTLIRHHGVFLGGSRDPDLLNGTLRVCAPLLATGSGEDRRFRRSVLLIHLDLCLLLLCTDFRFWEPFSSYEETDLQSYRKILLLQFGPVVSVRLVFHSDIRLGPAPFFIFYVDVSHRLPPSQPSYDFQDLVW